MTPNPSPSADVIDQRIAHWQAQEAALRQRMSHGGVAHPSQVAGKTGMAMFEAMLAGELPYPPISDTLDFILVEAEPGRVVFQGRPMVKHYNPLGTVHGGWFATLLDSAVACAVHTTLPAGVAYTTAELKINIVRPLTARVPLVRAEGKLIYAGRRMATAEGRLYDAADKLYAHATTTCFIFDGGAG